MDQKARFLKLFSSKALPDLSDDALNCMEDFLTTGFDSEIQPYVKTIVEYVEQNLKIIDSKGNSISVDDEHFYGRLLSELRFIKPTLFTKDTLKTVIDIMFKYLDQPNKIRILAFTYLVDYAQLGLGNNKIYKELLNWSIQFIKKSISNIASSDHEMLLTVVSLFKRILIDDDSIKSQFPHYTQVFLNTIKACFEYSDSDSFFPTFDHICAKSLRIIARIVYVVSAAATENMSLIIQIHNMIPRTTNFAHIYIDSIFLLLTMYSLKNVVITEEMEDVVRNEIVSCISLFDLPPFSNTLKTKNILITLRAGIIKDNKFSQNHAKTELLPLIYPLLSSTKIHKHIFLSASNLLQNLLCDESRRVITASITDTIEKLISILELILPDVYEYPEMWVEVSSKISGIIKGLIIPAFQHPSDEFPRCTTIELLSRFTKWISIIISLFGKIYNPANKDDDKYKKIHESQQKVFKASFYDILKFYCDIIENVPHDLIESFLDDHFVYFLTDDDSHTLVLTFISKLLPKVKNQPAFIISFFSTIAKHFEQMNIAAAESTYKLIIEIFNADGKIQLPPEPLKVLSNHIFKIILLSLKYKKLPFIEQVVNTIFKIITRMPPAAQSKFSALIELLRSPGIPWYSMLNNQQPELVFSRLALMMFPVVQPASQLVPPASQHLDVWYTLFLPVIEKKKDAFLFYCAVQNHFGEHFAVLPQYLQSQIVTALVNILSKHNKQEANYLRLLMSQIADVLPQTITKALPRGNSSIIVEVNERKVCVEDVVEASKQSEKWDTSFYLDVLVSAISKECFATAVTNEALNEIAERVEKEQPGILKALPPTTAGRWFRFLYANELDVPDSEVEDFVKEVAALVFNYDYAESVMKAFLEIIDRVPFGMLWNRIAQSCLQASHPEACNYSMKIAKKYVDRSFESEEDRKVLYDLYRSTFLLIKRYPYNTRHASAKVFKEILKIPYLNKVHMERLTSTAESLPKIVNSIMEFHKKMTVNPGLSANIVQITIGYKMLFERSFADIPDPTSIVQTICISLEKLKQDQNSKLIYYNLNYQNIIMRMLKETGPDPKYSTFCITCFFIKLAARFLISAPSPASYQIIDYLFTLLKDPFFHPFIPYFLKKIESGVEKGYGSYANFKGDINAYIADIANPSHADILVLQFLVRNGILSRVGTVLSIAANQIKNIRQTGSRADSMELAGIMFDIIKNCRPSIDNDSTLIQVLTNAIEYTIQLQNTPPLIYLPLHIIAEAYPSETVSILTMIMKRDQTPSVFILAEKLFIQPKMFEFKKKCIEQFFMHFNDAKAFIAKNPKTADFLPRCLRAAAEVISSGEAEPSLVFTLMKFAIQFIDAMRKGDIPVRDLTRYAPNTFKSYIDIFFPECLSKYIGMNEIMKTIATVAIPYTLDNPHIFHRQLFMQRFIKIMESVGDTRLDLFQSVIDNKPSKPESIAMWHTMIGEYLEKFDDYPGQIITSMENTESSKIVQTITNKHAAAMLVKYPQVTVEGVSDDPIITLSPAVQAEMIRMGAIDISTSATMIRSMHIAETCRVRNDDFFLQQMSFSSFFSKGTRTALATVSHHPDCIDLSRREFTFFMLGQAFAFNTQKNMQTIYVYNTCMLTIIKKMDPAYYPNFLNYYLAMVNSILKMEENQFKQCITLVVFVAQILVIICPKTPLREVEPGLLATVKKHLIQVFTEDKNNAMAFTQKVRLYLQLTTPLAPFLFSDPSYFPYVLNPSIIYNINNMFFGELLPDYKKALHACSLYSIRFVKKNVIAEIYKILSNIKYKKISPPLESAWATAILWTTEVDNTPQTQKEFRLVEAITEAFEPPTESQLIRDIKALKLPLDSPKAMQIVGKVIEKFPVVLNNNVPALISLFPKPVEDMVFACWNNPWYTQPEGTHIYIFTSFICPEPLLESIPFMSIELISKVCSVCLIDLVTTLQRFIMYYVKIFPDSSLSNVFYQTQLFSNRPPRPHLSHYENMFFLESITMNDDALGLLKERSKNMDLKIAASFHQLCQYDAARSHYLDAMDDLSAVGDSLYELRPVTLNLHFPTKIPITQLEKESITSLIYQSVTKSFAVTVPLIQLLTPETESVAIMNTLPSISSSYPLPMYSNLMRMIFLDESIRLLRSIQDQQFDDLEVRRWTNTWLDSLDKQCAVASSLGFKLIMINARPRNPQMNSINNLNRNKLSVYLAESGSIQRGLKMIRKTLPNPASTEKLIDNRQLPFPVDERNLPHVLKSLAQFNQPQVIQSGQVPVGIQKTRVMCLFYLKDIKSAMQLLSSTEGELNNQYIKVVTFMYNFFPRDISPSIFPLLFQHVKLPQPEQSNMAMALAFAILKKEPAHQAQFISAALMRFSIDSPNTWFRWLPHIFASFEQPSTELMKNLIKLRPYYFRAIMRNMSFSGFAMNNSYITKELTLVCKSMKEAQQMSEFDQAFVWQRSCEKEIHEFRTAVIAHIKMAEALSNNNFVLKPEFAEVVNNDLAAYCRDHPPYFKTDLKVAASQNPIIGFRFQLTHQKYYHIAIDAPGDREAQMIFTTLDGERSYYSLVSPHIYKTLHSEEILMYNLMKMYESMPAAKTRSCFVHCPNLFYVQENLLLINEGESTPIHEIAGGNVLWKLYQQRSQESSSSMLKPPKVIRQRKQIDINRDGLVQWVNEGAKGSLEDFIFMRQSLASYLAAISAIKFLFMSNYRAYPFIVFYNDRVRISLSQVTRDCNTPVHLPLTPTFQRFLPQHVLKGSLETTWHIVMTAISQNFHKVRIFLDALLSKEPSNLSDRVKERVNMAALAETDDTDKCDDPFAFALIDHLIAVSPDAFNSQVQAFAWV